MWELTDCKNKFDYLVKEAKDLEKKIQTNRYKRRICERVKASSQIKERIMSETAQLKALATKNIKSKNAIRNLVKATYNIDLYAVE